MLTKKDNGMPIDKTDGIVFNEFGADDKCYAILMPSIETDDFQSYN